MHLGYDAEETLQAAYGLNGLGLGSHTLEFEVSADVAKMITPITILQRGSSRSRSINWDGITVP